MDTTTFLLLREGVCRTHRINVPGKSLSVWHALDSADKRWSSQAICLQKQLICITMRTVLPGFHEEGGANKLILFRQKHVHA